QHAVRQHAPDLGARPDGRAGALEVCEERPALRPGAAERIAGLGTELGWELTVNLATGPGRLVEDQHLRASGARFDGRADARGARTHDDGLVRPDGGRHRRSPVGAGSVARPKPDWVSTTMPAPAGTRQVRTFASPSTTIRQSWQTPIAQNTPRGAPRWAVRRATRRSAASRAVAMVSPG